MWLGFVLVTGVTFHHCDTFRAGEKQQHVLKSFPFKGFHWPGRPVTGLCFTIGLGLQLTLDRSSLKLFAPSLRGQHSLGAFPCLSLWDAGRSAGGLGVLLHAQSWLVPQKLK